MLLLKAKVGIKIFLIFSSLTKYYTAVKKIPSIKKLLVYKIDILKYVRNMSLTFLKYSRYFTNFNSCT